MPASEPTCAPVVAPSAPAAGGWWGWLLASTRLSLSRVCSESAALGEDDYHNHNDDADGAAWHVEGRRRCVRCGKWYRTY